MIPLFQIFFYYQPDTKMMNKGKTNTWLLGSVSDFQNGMRREKETMTVYSFVSQISAALTLANTNL